MDLLIGVSTMDLGKDGIAVSAVCDYNRVPRYVVSKTTLQELRQKTKGIALVYNQTPITAVNTAIHRVFEKLLLHDITDPDKIANLKLLVGMELRDWKFILPHEVSRTHWLRYAARHALDCWRKDNDLWI